MNKTKILHVGLALGFAVTLGGAAGLISYNRDSFFEWQWVKPRGQFVEKEDAELRKNARLFYESKNLKPGMKCVDQWAGRDDRYLYMAIGCAKFEEKLGLVETDGDNNFIPTRFRYDGKDVGHYEQPDLSEFENSMKKLFPKVAYHLVIVRLNDEEFKKRGLALTNENAPPQTIPPAAAEPAK